MVCNFSFKNANIFKVFINVLNLRNSNLFFANFKYYNLGDLSSKNRNNKSSTIYYFNFILTEILVIGLFLHLTN